MSVPTQEGLRSALVDVGSKRVLVLAGGGALLLLGLVGLVLTPALTSETVAGHGVPTASS